MEIWKDIPGYEGKYQVSSEGRVKSVDCFDSRGHHVRERIRSFCHNRNGYLYVNLSKNGKPKNILVHRLVAEAFIKNPHNYETVNHINEIKTDNRVCNLEWMTLADNLRYGTHTERATKNKPDMSGEKHFNYGRRGVNAITHKGRVIGVSKTNPSDVVEFETASVAARSLGISTGQLCDAINGKAKSCGGYYWRRLND
jgi:hypothetical protein